LGSQEFVEPSDVHPAKPFLKTKPDPLLTPFSTQRNFLTILDKYLIICNTLVFRKTEIAQDERSVEDQLMREKVKKTRPLSKGSVLSRDDIRALGDVFRTYPAIQAVYLFGSIGAGKAHHTSDLDLAIVCRSKTLRGKKLALLTDLARCGFCDVDLVFLDTKDIVLKYEAVRQNRLVYSTPNFNRGSMYSKVVREYLDFAPYLKVQREAYKRRIERGSA